MKTLQGWSSEVGRVGDKVKLGDIQSYVGKEGVGAPD